MSLSDFLLEASRVLIGLGLSVFIGGTLAALFARSELPAGQDASSYFFLEGNPNGALGRAKFVAAGALLVGVLLETQVLGSSLPRRHIWRAVVLFLLVASLVYTVMVLRPKARYYDERSLTLAENLRRPWVQKRDAGLRKASIVSFIGFLLAVAALVLG